MRPQSCLCATLNSCVLAVSFSLALVPTAQADWLKLSSGVSAGFINDDNITRAEREFDILSDNTFSLEADVANSYAVNASSLLRFHGMAVINRYQDFSGLDNERVRMNLTYLFRPGQRFTSITWFVRAEYELRLFDNSQRDGDATRLSAGISKRLSDLLAMRLAYVDESIDVEEQRFDTQGSRVYLDLDYVLNATDTLYLSLSRYQGDVLSISNPLVTNAKLSGVPFSIDLAFPRPSASLFWWTYKLDGSTNALTLGAAFALDHKQGVDVSVNVYDTDAELSSQYSGMIFRLYYGYRF